LRRSEAPGRNSDRFDQISAVKQGELEQTAPLTIANLQKVFDKTESILRKLDRFYSGLVGEVKYMGEDDY